MVATKRTTRKPVKRTSKKRTVRKRRSVVIDAKTEAQRISHYLRALQAKKKVGRGPRVKPEVLARRVESARLAVSQRTGIRQLEAVQRLRDLEKKAADPTMNGNFERFEAQFIESAKSFGDRKGIDYGSWRAVGVDADVLKKAGIARTR